MKRLLSVFISICMITLLLPVGAAAVEVTPETPTRVACAYFVDDSGELKQVYYDSLGDAVAAAQGDNANGRVYIAKTCSYEGDLTINQPTVFACNNDARVIVTMTGTMTLNAPLTIQHGAAFHIEAGSDDEACVNDVTQLISDQELQKLLDWAADEPCSNEANADIDDKLACLRKKMEGV